MQTLAAAAAVGHGSRCCGAVAAAAPAPVLAVVARAVAGVLALAAVAEVLVPAAAGHKHAFVQHRPVRSVLFRLECWACCWCGC